jgi:hypothetical protein
MISSAYVLLGVLPLCRRDAGPNYARITQLGRRRFTHLGAILPTTDGDHKELSIAQGKRVVCAA